MQTMSSLTITRRIRDFRCPSSLAANRIQPEYRRERCQYPSRYHSTSSDSDSGKSESPGVRIPKPTWSIQELHLTAKRPPLPDEELDRLSKLALIDIKSMKPQIQESLGQDLANMLHMIDQVTRYSSNEQDSANSQHQKSVEEEIQAAAEIYDLVRGVTKAPLRKSAEEDHLQTKDSEIAKDVWENMLQPKTKRMGGTHEYFAIQTKTEKTDE